jgi:hypothetical protein
VSFTPIQRLLAPLPYTIALSPRWLARRYRTRPEDLAAVDDLDLAGAVSFPCSLPCLQGNPNIRSHLTGALDRVRQLLFSRTMRFTR